MFENLVERWTELVIVLMKRYVHPDTVNIQTTDLSSRDNASKANVIRLEKFKKQNSKDHLKSLKKLV